MSVQEFIFVRAFWKAYRTTQVKFQPLFDVPFDFDVNKKIFHRFSVYVSITFFSSRARTRELIPTLPTFTTSLIINDIAYLHFCICR